MRTSIEWDDSLVVADMRQKLHSLCQPARPGTAEVFRSARFEQHLNSRGEALNLVSVTMHRDDRVVNDMRLPLGKALELHDKLRASGMRRNVRVFVVMEDGSVPTVFE